LPAFAPNLNRVVNVHHPDDSTRLHFDQAAFSR
jgi:hypothetical protein